MHFGYVRCTILIFVVCFQIHSLVASFSYSIIAIILLTVVVVIRSVSSLRNGEATDRGLIKNWPTDMVSGLTCISYCSLTFLCHFNLFAIEGELRRVSFRKMQGIIVVSMTFAFIIYLFVTLFGYLQV